MVFYFYSSMGEEILNKFTLQIALASEALSRTLIPARANHVLRWDTR